MDVEAHRQPGQRMVEVDDDSFAGMLLQHPRDPQAIGAGEFDDVARTIFDISAHVRIEHRPRQRLDQFRTARAEAGARRQLETRVRALGQADQPILKGRSKIACADRQRRRLGAERADHFALLVIEDHRDTIMKRDMRSSRNAGNFGHEPDILVEMAGVTIKDWPESERPRERLLAHGPQVLSDAELIAIFLRTGMAGRTALDLGRDALLRFGGLSGLLAAAPSELAAIPGFGPAKAAQLQAVLELARRSLREDVCRDTVLGSPGAVRDFLRITLARREHEVFMALFLDAQNRLLAAEELFRGTLTQTSVYPREVVKRALALNAAALIFAHNHPSGLAEPSRSDELLTGNLKQALALVDVRVLDHLIVAGAATVSFAERGLL